ncbi:hypothetical protein EWM64_g5907 [Hericium alpestre]|uniref:Uncharacterized protein n=1 Tax=Hericium alpestre TaxID=135208 RepID=A0A4Y9ZVM6_9AGAM|nr:hypothetical protein EWM64_g5907 [Hericium alpestre]
MEVDDPASNVFMGSSDIDWEAVDREIAAAVAPNFDNFNDNQKSNPNAFQMTAFFFFLVVSAQYNERKLKPEFLKLTQSTFAEVVRKHPEVLEVLLRANVDKSFGRIRELAYLKEPGEYLVGFVRLSVANFIAAPIASHPEGGTTMVDKQESWETTVNAWKGIFKGKSYEELLKHIRSWIFRTESYAHCMGIIQSSGMGKSRCVDELSKHRFVVPLNLRDPKGEGFPPSDTCLYDFFSPVPEDKRVAESKAQAFLVALFEQVIIEVNRLKGENPGGDINILFRQFMTKGQKFHAHGPGRQRFYDRVITRTKNLLGSESRISGTDTSPRHAFGPEASEVTLLKGAQRAVEAVDSDYPSDLPESPTPAKSKHSDTAIPAGRPVQAEKPRDPGPTIILAFDEAHTMDVGLPKEALFMTTTGKISTFSAPSQEDASGRVLDRELFLIPPFCNLGFDQHAPKILRGSDMTLDQVVADEHIGRLGRPLFATRYDAAAQSQSVSSQNFTGQFAELKLLGRVVKREQKLQDSERLACLSQRLPIEFQTTRYNTSDAERRQVENHMRVCLKVSDDLQSMTTINPSEPILSEAAFRIMDSREDFNVPSALRDVLQGFSVHQGDRGELVALLLLTMARDQAVHDSIANGVPREQSRMVPVTAFLSHLFGSSAAPGILSATPSVVKDGSLDANVKLCDQFKDSHLHFNHFVKVHEHNMVNRKYLWRLMSRGAAVLCADAITPFTYKDKVLNEENIGVILWQIKNNPAYTSTIKREFYDPLMNPHILGILDSGETTVPIIRVVLALAGNTPALKSVPCTPGATGQFTSYDIWCSGMSPKFYGPITEGSSKEVWDALLHASRGWEKLYSEGDKESQQLRMSMNPGAATDPRFFQEWAPLE